MASTTARDSSPSPWRWPTLSKDRLITLLAADLLLLTSVLTTLLLPHIPSPLLYPVWGLAKAYAIYLQLLVVPCLLGVWGAVKESTLPTHILSSTLLLDALVSLPPRLLLLASLARAPARCITSPAGPTMEQGVIWTRCADAAVGPILVVVVVVLGSVLEVWGGWWVRGFGRRLGEEEMRRERERGRESKGEKEGFFEV